MGRRAANLRCAVLDRAAGYEPRNRRLAVARTLVALAELTNLLLSSDSVLFMNTPGSTPQDRCTGLADPTLWCALGERGDGGLEARILAAGVLCLAAAGLAPRWTCLPHWYVAFSFSVDVTIGNGGDQVAQVFTMLLIPQCLGDPRLWQWSAAHGAGGGARATRALPAVTRGSAYAAQLILRIQIAVIYLECGVEKLARPEWRNGCAMHSLMNDPQFGFPPPLREIAAPLLDRQVIAIVLGWSVVAVEIAIALLVLSGAFARRYALTLAVCLHIAIILALGLFSFGLIMIGTVLSVSAADPVLERRPVAETLATMAISR
jgi:antimicrobial peptide system SdpB family protein